MVVRAHVILGIQTLAFNFKMRSYMRHLSLIACVLLLVGIAAQAQSPTSSSTEQIKNVPSFDLNAMDKSADPCNDFYQYACGNWIKNNPIPADQPEWGRFNELHERNQLILRNILDKTSADKPGRSSNDQKIGDHYYSCMDEAGIDAKGMAPLKPMLDRIAALQDKSQLPGLIGELHNKYVQHVTNMFHLLGESPEKATADAKTVLTLETELAKAAMDRVERRDPNKVYHKMTTAQLQQLSPAFTWKEYFVTVASPSFDSLDVSVPDFVKGMNQLVATSSLEDIKTYLRWQTAHHAATLLPTAFVNEDFAFYGKILTGAKELHPRWKRCVQFTNRDLGEALGKAYVAEEFPPESKAATLKMVHELEAALKTDITEVSWMTEETKKQALDKLSHIENKIGYPDKWRDYSTLTIVRGDALGNGMRAHQFEFKRELDKIGRPVDRREWGMTPPTVNAYYNPQENNINFPAGILQPPFYDPKVDDAVNFGAIGAVIGHELTHGFDDSGSQFDAQGNLRNWWTPKDREQFDKLEGCFVKEYDGFVAVDDIHVRGQLTLGENTADNGGLRIADMALLDVLGNAPQKSIDGYTPEQRLFVGWGQVW